MIIQTRIKSGEYHDSVTLLRVAQSLTKAEGVVDAAVVMGTPANLELLETAQFLSDNVKQVTPNDLIIAIKGETEDHISSAMRAAEAMLSAKTSRSVDPNTQTTPQSLAAAIERSENANIVLISVTGRYAVPVAYDALAKNQHVFLFSDNVSLEDEINLKKQAHANGLFVMGPDAGTAIINGVALGFANQVLRGPVGIVAASGTGLQSLSSALSQNNVGISQAIGVGGRDLSPEVGGIMMLQGYQALIADPTTEVIVLVSKPPSHKVAKKILKLVKECKKPTIVCFLGGKVGAVLASGGIPALTLDEAAAFATALSRGKVIDSALAKLEKQRKKLKRKAQDIKPLLTENQIYFRGLFSGGTLCYETQLILGEMLGIKKIRSNAPLNDKQKLYNANNLQCHAAVDLGADEFTVGRLHPMLDPTLRNRLLGQQALAPQTAVIYIDIVLGYGVHPDPAGAVIPAIQQAQAELKAMGRTVIFMASVCGTSEDPQNLGSQEHKLRDAGVLVMRTNASAAYLAGYLLS